MRKVPPKTKIPYEQISQMGLVSQNQALKGQIFGWCTRQVHQ